MRLWCNKPDATNTLMYINIIALIFARPVQRPQMDVCNLWCDSCFNRLLYPVNLSYSAGPQWMQRAHLCWNEGLSDLPVECRCGVLCVGQSQSRSRLPDLCSEKNVSGSLFIVSAQSRSYKDQQTDPNIKTLINLWLYAFWNISHCCVRI